PTASSRRCAAPRMPAPTPGSRTPSSSTWSGTLRARRRPGTSTNCLRLRNEDRGTKEKARIEVRPAGRRHGRLRLPQRPALPHVLRPLRPVRPRRPEARGQSGPAERAQHQYRIHGLAAKGLDVTLQPDASLQSVHLDQKSQNVFTFTNNSDQTVHFRAIHDIFPADAATHMALIQCFCFSDQTMKPHETKSLPVIYQMNDGLNPLIERVSVMYTLEPLAPAVAAGTGQCSRSPSTPAAATAAWAGRSRFSRSPARSGHPTPPITAGFILRRRPSLFRIG